jgi:Meckel syndrome type 1 protein
MPQARRHMQQGASSLVEGVTVVKRASGRRVLALALSVSAFGAWAQSTSSPAPAAKADAAAEAAAAMERAQRLAANPMRVILEAAKIKRRPGEAADAGGVAEASDASLRRTAARPADAAAAPVATVAAPAATTAPAVTRPPEERVLSASATPVAPQAVPALEAAGTAAPIAAVFGTAVPSLAAIAEVKPKLVSQVEPVFGSRLQDDAARLTEVTADLTLRADGTVAQVALVTNVARPLQRPLIAALEAWRFEPLPAQRVHRVQLVFTADK